MKYQRKHTISAFSENEPMHSISLTPDFHKQSILKAKGATILFKLSQRDNLDCQSFTLQNVFAKTINNNKKQVAHRRSQECRDRISKESLSHQQNRKRDKQGHADHSQFNICKNNYKPDVSREHTQKLYGRNRRRINISILQRINQTLQHYPNLASQFKYRQSYIQYCTQSSDEQFSDFEKDAVDLQRLVLWSQSKLKKVMQKLYDYLMMGGNNNEGAKKKVNISNENDKRNVSKLLKSYLLSKYKTDKLSRQNFINLCYSLYYYLDKSTYELGLPEKQKQIVLMKIRYFSIFQRFINLKYDYQDLIFYLYSKCIFKQILKINPSHYQEIYYISASQLRQFLVMLSNNDSELIFYYQNYISKCFQNLNNYELYSVLYFLINDFKIKKEKIQNKDNTLDYDCLHNQKSQSKSVNFKTENQLNYLINSYKYDRQFWTIEPPNEQEIIQPLYEILQDEIGYQLKKLIGLLCQNMSEQYIDFINQLVLIKAIRMLNCVYKMNKNKWFQQMGLISNHTTQINNQDLLQIQILQQEMKVILRNFKAKILTKKSIKQFSKRLLTPNTLLNKLHELIEHFQVESTLSQ